MKLSTPFHCLSAAVAFGFAAATSMHAETVLFEDEFDLSDKAGLTVPAAREEINREAAQRQQGSLAPTEYSSNGKHWQQQLYGGPSTYGALRLYPKKDGNLLLSPAWSLEEKAGNFVLGLRALPVGREEIPEQIFIALGGSAGLLSEGVSTPLAGALIVRVRNSSEPTVTLMQDGSEISDAASFPGLTTGGELAVRWTQGSGREISEVEVLLDGTSIFKHEGDVLVGGNHFVFGARVGAEQPTEDGFGSVAIDSLRYTRE